MKAAVLYETNTPLKVEDVTLDDPQQNEILVKIVASGKAICLNPSPSFPGMRGQAL
jgi:Zn-dependent alcohol dehydrogenase